VAVAEGRSVTQALREAKARRVPIVVSTKSLEAARPSKYQGKTQTPQGVRAIPPPPPLCARPIGGPRVSSAAWHRLGCLLRGTTRPRLCTPCPSCMHLPGAGVPTQGTSHWGHPLGEPNEQPAISNCNAHDPVTRRLHRQHLTWFTHSQLVRAWMWSKVGFASWNLLYIESERQLALFSQMAPRGARSGSGHWGTPPAPWP
jgi:hypothetical protein